MMKYEEAIQEVAENVAIVTSTSKEEERELYIKGAAEAIRAIYGNKRAAIDLRKKVAEVENEQ